MSGRMTREAYAKGCSASQRSPWDSRRSRTPIAPIRRTSQGYAWNDMTRYCRGTEKVRLRPADLDEATWRRFKQAVADKIPKRDIGTRFGFGHGRVNELMRCTTLEEARKVGT